ncbi:hypothetical protein PFNF54_03981 [Plasmodium falciparum NF54]|uniref:Uncharacterized protein n=1 Tax=Plasmodium falciparum (isolate NF54) TaxID=5843 RepID=W7K341_PLAFO|nr:hypothetical protein PFNF54_03981 [Plasmodium falciparum NF54]
MVLHFINILPYGLFYKMLICKLIHMNE